jgi:hypothetical protein
MIIPEHVFSFKASLFMSKNESLHLQATQEAAASAERMQGFVLQLQA